MAGIREGEWGEQDLAIRAKDTVIVLIFSNINTNKNIREPPLVEKNVMLLRTTASLTAEPNL